MPTPGTALCGSGPTAATAMPDGRTIHPGIRGMAVAGMARSHTGRRRARLGRALNTGFRGPTASPLRRQPGPRRKGMPTPGTALCGSGPTAATAMPDGRTIHPGIRGMAVAGMARSHTDAPYVSECFAIKPGDDQREAARSSAAHSTAQGMTGSERASPARDAKRGESARTARSGSLRTNCWYCGSTSTARSRASSPPSRSPRCTRARAW